MKILVINSGSSSLKYQLFSMPAGDVLARGLAERIGEPEGALHQHSAAGEVDRRLCLADHRAALSQVMGLLSEGVIDDVTRIAAVGHRVVHGGEHFTGTALIDAAVIEAIEDHVELAPLHNPANLMGIRVMRELLPGVPQVAVFDTAFHQSMPERAYRYALPTELYRQARVRRYGFHGTSHHFVAERAAEMLGRDLSQLKLITVHLGNGASACAIDGGRSVDTSMGLTPLEGLVMGTRCGDLDPAVIFHLARTRGLDLDAIDRLLNKKSGLLGLSGHSNDMRSVVQRAEQGDAEAELAMQVYAYRVKKYIGAYFAVLGGADAVVFTAGIGEHSAQIRALATQGLQALGIVLDAQSNQQAQGECDVSAGEASTRTLVVPTNEELMIARQTFAVAEAA